MSTTTNPQNDRRTLTQRGEEVGNENTERLQNQVNQMSPVLKITCPRKFTRIDYAAGIHPTRFVPRTMESVTGTAGDDTTVELDTNLLPVAGEPEVENQNHPVVRAVNVATGEEIDVAVSHYGTNTVELQTDPNDGEEVKLYPVIADGTIQYRGIDQFNHEVGALDEWGSPLQDFLDHDMMKADGRIHLGGRITWRENETLAVMVNSPTQIVWEDADFPESYVSSFEQKVDVSV